MATGARRVNIFLKKFLTQQQMTDNFLDYLLAATVRVFAETYPQQGVFRGGAMSGSTSNEATLVTPLVATDGLGHVLQLDPTYADFTFENSLGVPYHVGLRYAEIFQETEVNVRTGQIEYTFHEEAIGELAEPDAIVDGGSQLTITVDSVCEAGVSNAGRKVLVYLKRAVGQADSSYIGTVTWNGSNNRIVVPHLLGQTAGLVSTDPTKYQAFLLGPTVKRNTDLSLDPNVVYLGTVTGAGTGNTPVTVDQDDVRYLIPAGSIGNIHDEVKSFLVGGGLITWDLDSETLTWADPFEIKLPNRPHNFDIAAGSQANIADGDVLYFTAALPGGTKPLVKVPANSMPDDVENYPLIMRVGNNIYFRDGALELKGVSGDDTSGQINDITQDLLDYMGATDESDSDPNYPSSSDPDTIVDNGDSLTTGIDKLNAQVTALAKNNPGQHCVVVPNGGQSVWVIPTPVSPFDTDNAIFDVEVYAGGRKLDQDETGGTNRDFRKIADDTIEITNPIFTVEGVQLTFWKQGTAYGGTGGGGGGGGMDWSDPVDASLVPNVDAVHDVGSAIRRFGEGHFAETFVNDPKIQSALGAIGKVRSGQNGGIVPITAGSPVAKHSDGTLRVGRGDTATGQKFVGIALATIAPGAFGNFLAGGDVLPGVLIGSGFAPGQDIYMGPTGGYTNDPDSLDVVTDSIVYLGVADCANAAASPTVADLILMPGLVSRP